MRNPTRWLLVTALLGLSLQTWARAADTDTPTMDQMHQMYDDKKYEEVVKKVAYILTLHNEVGKSYDHYELYMLKGEAQMGRKQPAAAGDAFTQAVKETSDRKLRAMAIAMAELSRHSPNMKFTPQTGAAKGQPIDITDPAGRAPAFTALFTDELNLANRNIKSAITSTSLPPMFEAVGVLRKLSALEIAATGDDVQVAALGQQIGDHVQTLVGDVVNQYGNRVGEIERAAQATITVTDPSGNTVSGQTGLGSKEQKELKGIVTDCVQITPAVKELAEGTNDKALDELAAKSDKVKADAERVLHTSYAGGWGSTNGNGTGTGTVPRTVGP